MIKNIIFDMGGVLVSLDRRRCVRAFANDLGFADFGDYLSAYVQSGFFALYEDGAINTARFRDHVRVHSTNAAATDEMIDNALASFLTEIKKEKFELLMNLKEEYNLILLSNNNPIAYARANELMKEVGGVTFADIFSKMFLSFERKCSKPGEEIYNLLIEECDINPEETLFIDDSQANIETAINLGFRCLLYNVEDSLPVKVTAALNGNGGAKVQW